MLRWLEYSIKRGLGMEGNNASAIQEGIQQTTETIYKLKRHKKQMTQIKTWVTALNI